MTFLDDIRFARKLAAIQSKSIQLLIKQTIVYHTSNIVEEVMGTGLYYIRGN